MNNIITDKEETLSDAQKNKLKVMSHELNFSTKTFSSIRDKRDEINANIDEKSLNVLTDAQRNRLKVMGHEFEMIDVKRKDVNPKINI
jgi:hypothetical protein